MPPVSLLIKPASSNCNLRCKYCFYNSISENRKVSSYGMMGLDILEILVKKAFDYAEQSCTFAFQGGEPTLVGLEFYKALIKFVENYNIKMIKVQYAIQTNGMVVTEEWAKFFSDSKFLVGISLDGIKDLHDLMRVDAKGKGSYMRVLKAIELLNKYKVEYNILCVVNNYTARHVYQVYTFFKKNNFNYLQFIPCLDPLVEQPGGNEHSLTPQRYTDFLKQLFDLWYQDIEKGEKISIRYFDNLIAIAMGYPPESCGMSGMCSTYFVIEANGGVYPCDFYVTDEWYMGSIIEQDFTTLRKSDKVENFIEVSKFIDPKCKECQWYGLCRGGCRRDREPFVGGKPVLNTYCTSFKEFFAYSSARIAMLARKFR